LTDVEDEPIRVPDVAAWHGRIFLYDRATGFKQLALCGSDIGHKKFKDRTMLFALFDVESERTGFKADNPCVLTRYWQAEHRTVKVNDVGPPLSAKDYIARRFESASHRSSPEQVSLVRDGNTLSQIALPGQRLELFSKVVF
jgi:hypothetical protein